MGGDTQREAPTRSGSQRATPGVTWGWCFSAGIQVAPTKGAPGGSLEVDVLDVVVDIYIYIYDILVKFS